MRMASAATRPSANGDGNEQTDDCQQQQQQHFVGYDDIRRIAEFRL